MDIIITLSTKEMIRHNTINYSMSEYMSTSGYDELYNGVSKSTFLEPTMKHLTK